MKVLVVCKHSHDSREAEVCRRIDVDGIEVKHSWKNKLEPEDTKGIDLVISVGGDGTALSASHFLNDKPLLAVNSSPETSEGALTTISVDELEGKVQEILDGKVKKERLERIEVLINGKRQNPLALNEVFMANEKAYLVSRYRVNVGKKEEKQVSSGLIFATGTGSTAWFRSAGGKPFSSQAKYIEMLVREPYQGRINKFSMLHKKVKEGESIEVVPLTRMVLAIDSIREVCVTPKDVVTIRVSEKPLTRII